MNSFNHYAYGAIGEWMYKNIGGIDQKEESSGYKNIIIAPKPGGGIIRSSIEFESVYGTIACHWNIDNKKMIMNVEVPPNTNAEVVFPDIRKGDVFESGTSITTAVRGNIYPIGSGKYSFSFDVE